jgi:hypothetical protein
MRTEHLGPDELLVAAKIELLDGLDVAEVTDIVNRVESSIRRAVPSARVIYLEPDIFRTTLPAEFDMPPAADATPEAVEPEVEAPLPPPPPPPPAPTAAHEEALVEPD